MQGSNKTRDELPSQVQLGPCPLPPAHPAPRAVGPPPAVPCCTQPELSAVGTLFCIRHGCQAPGMSCVQEASFLVHFCSFGTKGRACTLIFLQHWCDYTAHCKAAVGGKCCT